MEALFRSDHYVSGFDETVPCSTPGRRSAGSPRARRSSSSALSCPGHVSAPAVLARSAATADEIAGGRVTLGMGAGWMEREHDAYGFEFGTTRERVSRLGEQIEIVHGLLHEDRVDFEGTYYKLADAPGLDRPELPILVGGSAKPGTAGPRSDSPTNTTPCSARSTRPGKQATARRSLRAWRRDPSTLRYSLMAPCVIGRNDQEVSESAARIGARFGRIHKRCSSAIASTARSGRSIRRSSA